MEHSFFLELVHIATNELIIRKVQNENFYLL